MVLVGPLLVLTQARQWYVNICACHVFWGVQTKVSSTESQILPSEAVQRS